MKRLLNIAKAAAAIYSSGVPGDATLVDFSAALQGINGNTGGVGGNTTLFHHQVEIT